MKKNIYFFLLVIVSFTSAKAQTQELARIKAIFILNFIKYSDHQAANNAQEFIVGVYRDEDLQRELLKICANSYHGKKVVVKQLQDFSTPVHLLFIPEKNHSTYQSYIKKSGDISQTMIVTDKADETSMISFEIRDSKFYFRLNDTLLTKAGIKLSESIKAIAINNRS
jgi:hypothetical protein